jgi:hypothetical protein
MTGTETIVIPHNSEFHEGSRPGRLEKIDPIRALTMDAVLNAKSGHPICRWAGPGRRFGFGGHVEITQ